MRAVEPQGPARPAQLLIGLPSERLIVSLVFLLVCVWRIPWLVVPFWTGVDESQSIGTALLALRDHTWVPYLLGQDYMGTIQEQLLAPVYACFGFSLLTTRVFIVVLFALSAVLFYIGFRTFLSRSSSLLATALIALGSSSQVYFTVASSPDYDFCYVLVAALPLTAYLARERPGSWPCLLLFAVTCGVSMYTHTLLFMNVTVCILWLWSGFGTWDETRAALAGSFGKRPAVWLASAGAVLCAGLLLAPLAYWSLTRGIWIRRGSQMDLLQLSAVPLLLLLAAIPLALIAGPLRRSLLRREVIVCAVCLLFFVLVPMICYRLFWGPWITMYSLDSRTVHYRWKNPAELPAQFRLFFGSVLPALILGKMNSVLNLMAQGRQTARDSTARIAIAGAIFLVSLALGCYWMVRDRLQAARGRLMLYVVPSLVCLASLIPSWRLHGIYSYRYLLLFMPGVWIGAAAAHEYRTGISRRVLQLAAVAYLVFCGVDTLTNVPLSRPSQQILAASQEIDREGIELAVGPREELRNIQFLRGNHTLYLDTARMPFPGLFTSPEAMARARVIGFWKVPAARQREILARAGLPPDAKLEPLGSWQILRRQL